MFHFHLHSNFIFIFTISYTLFIFLFSTYATITTRAKNLQKHANHSSQPTTTTTNASIPVLFEGIDILFYWNNTADSHADPWQGDAKYSYNLTSNDESNVMRMYQLWFSSSDNLKTFSKDPWSYMPQWGGFCAWGICCELPPQWPWESDHLGPPAGMDYTDRGWVVYDDKLYFVINQPMIVQFEESADSNIEAGNERWENWFGTLNGGVINYQCYTNENFDMLECMSQGQPPAPAVGSHDKVNFK